MSATRAGGSLRFEPTSPGVFGMGSHTNVMRVFPLSPRAVPIHVRTTDALEGRAVAALSAFSTGLGTAAFGGAEARAVSAAVSAQYPFLARTWMPGRFTRTLIS